MWEICDLNVGNVCGINVGNRCDEIPLEKVVIIDAMFINYTKEVLRLDSESE